MYGYSGLGDRLCVNSGFTIGGSPLTEIGTATSPIDRLQALINRCLLVYNCPVPIPEIESVRAIAPQTFESWQISKCKANESQPSQKITPKNQAQK
jgi:hypothetical protein